jgi:hypothetical protein
MSAVINKNKLISGANNVEQALYQELEKLEE